MISRKALIAELKRIERMDPITPVLQMRMKQICKIINTCICRTCKKEYDEEKARADYKGFCSMKCQHELARRVGYRKTKDKQPNKTEYSYLQIANQVGSIYKVN